MIESTLKALQTAERALLELRPFAPGRGLLVRVWLREPAAAFGALPVGGRGAGGRAGGVEQGGSCRRSFDN